MVLVDDQVPNPWFAECHGEGLMNVLFVRIAPWCARKVASEDMIRVLGQSVEKEVCH